jgi:hypothetical protein
MQIATELVAPCGINCSLCMRYLATIKGKNKELKISQCLGCRPTEKKCAFIKGHCEKLKSNKVRFCYECSSFPCKRLETLNRRYTNKYKTNLIGNLKEIQRKGLDAWLKEQETLWRCPTCGGMISIHTRKCYTCGYQKADGKV